MAIVLRDSAVYNLATTLPQTVTIADNNAGALPGVGFAIAASGGPESQFIVSAVVSLSAPSSVPVLVTCGIAGGTAVNGVDYDTDLPTTLYFPPGLMSQSVNIAGVNNNANPQPDRTIIAALSNPVNALLDAITNHTYTIEDDDASGTVTVSWVKTNASEVGPVTGIFRISRSGSTNSDVTVYYEVSGTASSPTDYLPIGSSVTIPAGQSQVDIIVTPIDDQTPEPTESVVLTLTGVIGGSIGTLASAIIWIADNVGTPALPIVTMTASAPFGSEAGPVNGAFTIFRDRDTDQPLDVSFTLGGTAVEGADYLAIGNSVTFPSGSSQAIVPVIPRWNGAYSSDKTVVATLTVVGTYRVPTSGASAIVTLLGGMAPGITTQPQTQTVASGSDVTFTVVATGNPPPAYLWRFNGVDLSGATNSVLTLTNVPVTSAGNYDCLLTNAFGAITSSVATLSITRDPVRFDLSPTALQTTNGVFQLRLVGLAGAGPVVLYASTDLSAWRPILTNPPVVGALGLMDVGVTNYPQRYYKAEEMIVP